MRRLSTASFLPFSSDSLQPGPAGYRQDVVSDPNTAIAVLELDEPARHSSWRQSEAPIDRPEADASEELLFFAERPFELSVSEGASMMTAHQHPVVGAWRLLSSEATIVDEGKTEVCVTEKPKGYIMFTPWGRMMTVCVGGHGDRKKVPTSQADFSDLWKTMLAYTGKYRVEGDEIVTKVDVSWFEVWTGTEQRRQFSLEGDQLTIVSKPQPIGTGHRPKSIVSCRVVWEREG